MRAGRWRVAAGLCVTALLALSGCTPGLGLPAAAEASVEPEPVPVPSVSPIPTLSDLATPSPTVTATTTPVPSGTRATPAGRAPSGSFAVASRQVELSRGANRPLRTVIWYPSANGGVAPGVFPLVLFSHGLTATPESYQRVATRIAAAGFVVAAPAYPFTSGDAETYYPADLINQPADGAAVISGVLALNSTPNDPLAGHLDTERIGAVGHSAGGYTTAGMLAGGRDTRLRAAIVIAGGSLGGSFTGPATPVLVIHGDRDPVVSYGIGQSLYGMVPWPKAMLTVVGGDHSTYLFSGTSAGTAVATGMLNFLRWTLYDDVTARDRLVAEAAVPGSTTFIAEL